MAGKMAVIGDGDSVLAFRAGGVDAFATENSDTARATLKRIAKSYQIIFITDSIAVDLDETINGYTSEPYPIIIPIPAKTGSNGYGEDRLKKEMEKSLGVDILFKK